MKFFSTTCIIVILFVICHPASAQVDCKLEVSPDGRLILDQSGNPFFLNGDTGWNLGIKLNREEVEYYLDKRKSQKFNLIGMAALFEQNTTNVYGDTPFGKTDGKWDPAKIRENSGNNPEDTLAYDYWDHIDFAVSEVKKRGMYLAFVISFNAMVVGDGKGEKREQIVFDEENAYEYGRWMGNRYKNEDHIIWMMGGDRSPVYGTYDYRPVYHAMAEGVADGIKGKNKMDGKADYSGVMMSYHPQKARPASSTWFHEADWLSFNSIQACPANQVNLVTNDLKLKPPKPTWLFEGRYEQYTYQWKPWHMRFQAYLTVMSGAFGHVYGNRHVWNYIADWERHLVDPGALDMTHLYDLFNNQFSDMPWGALIPYDKILLNKNLGKVEDICWRNATSEAPRADNIKAMIAKDRKKAVIYSANGRSFKINLRELAAQPEEAYWYNPRTGHWFFVKEEREYAEKKNFLTTSMVTGKDHMTFDPPGNPGFDNDWILILGTKK